MKGFYAIFAGCVFLLFCFVEIRGTTTDRNDISPKPNIYTSRGGGGSSRVGGFGFFSSK